MKRVFWLEGFGASEYLPRFACGLPPMPVDDARAVLPDDLKVILG
jgi:hypothetical protein